MKENTKSTEQQYIVVINGYYIRDAQVVTNENTEATKDELQESYENEDFKDLYAQDIYLGVYIWDPSNEYGLKLFVAKKRGLCVNTLQAYKIN